MVSASSFRSSPKCISFPLWRAFTDSFLSIPKATRQYINTKPYINTWYLDFCVCLGGPQDSRLLLPYLPPQTLSTHLPDAPAQIHFNHVTALFKNLQWHSPSHQTKTAWFSKCWIIVPNPTHTTVLSAALLPCVWLMSSPREAAGLTTHKEATFSSVPSIFAHMIWACHFSATPPTLLRYTGLGSNLSSETC